MREQTLSMFLAVFLSCGLPQLHSQLLSTPSHLCKKWIMFLGTLLGLALPYQQTEAEKGLPLGGAVAILDFKTLPSALETANLTRVIIPAHQVLPTRQKLPASAPKQ